MVKIVVSSGMRDRTFVGNSIDWSMASNGVIKTRVKGKEIIIPLYSILYIESD